MRWKSRNPLGYFTLGESIEVDAPIAVVFKHWTRYEQLPRFMESVRRTKRIDARRVLWDVDLVGHQLVWEARIVEYVPEKLIRWESSWGAVNSGEVGFESVTEGRTRLKVSMAFEAKGAVEHLGARLGLADLHVRRDLDRFRRFIESGPPEEPAGERGRKLR